MTRTPEVKVGTKKKRARWKEGKEPPKREGGAQRWKINLGGRHHAGGQHARWPELAEEERHGLKGPQR